MASSSDDTVSYASYLDLDRILSAQHPASDAHDEMLFITRPANFG